MTLQILKIDDSIIISRLSSKKILCKYKVPIVFESGFYIRDIEVKGRYKNDDIQMLKSGTLVGVISKAFSVKMKNIQMVWEIQTHELPFGKKDIKLIKKICIFDKIFERDYKLKELCKQV